MQIALLGQTDKRPILYTMLSMCENLGDCCFITNDRKAMRLMEDGPGEEGTYRNISIFVTDATIDDVWHEIGHAPSDYDYTFYDNLYSEFCDAVIYIMGAGPEEEDAMVLAAFEDEDYIHIKFGKPLKKAKLKTETAEDAEDAPKPVKNKGKAQKQEETYKTHLIPYTADLMANIEFCEYYKILKPISSACLKTCSEVLSTLTKIPAKNLAASAQRATTQKGGGK